MTLDPASAAAVSRCLIARLTGGSSVHPRPCAWEDYGRTDLAHLLADFNDDARYDDRSGRYLSAPVEQWRIQPHAAQDRQITAAQYPEAP